MAIRFFAGFLIGGAAVVTGGAILSLVSGPPERAETGMDARTTAIQEAVSDIPEGLVPDTAFLPDAAPGSTPAVEESDPAAQPAPEPVPDPPGQEGASDAADQTDLSIATDMIANPPDDPTSDSAEAPVLSDVTPSAPQETTDPGEGSAQGNGAGLPQITDTEADEPDVAAEQTPLTRFAAPAAADPPDLPRVAIVLLDDGSSPFGPQALGALPFPVTIAIDPEHPTAMETAQGYRANGLEVLAVARVAEGAEPADAEIAIEAALTAVPEAIGILEAPEGGLQGSRGVAAQVASVLAKSGHGLVSMPQGLNTGQQLAAQEGVPSAALFRDFDSQGQDARVIRRFLDQGAFRAGQEGAVIMLGRLRADTISALVQWGLQDRGSAVALVPVSVVLRETIAPAE